MKVRKVEVIERFTCKHCGHPLAIKVELKSRNEAEVTLTELKDASK